LPPSFLAAISWSFFLASMAVAYAARLRRRPFPAPHPAPKAECSTLQKSGSFYFASTAGPAPFARWRFGLIGLLR
jgi:hypothetical protein